jgi:hypothetical protein
MKLSIQIPFLITLLSNLISASDRVEFECESKKVTNIKYLKNNYALFPPLEYLQPEKPKMEGKLFHDLVVTGGDCFDLIIRGRQNKNEYTEMVKLHGSPTPKTMEPEFQNLNLCQDIAMQRMIQYDEREPYQYKQGDVTEGEAANSMEPQDGQLTCYHRVRLSKHIILAL